MSDFERGRIIGTREGGIRLGKSPVANRSQATAVDGGPGGRSKELMSIDMDLDVFEGSGVEEIMALRDKFDTTSIDNYWRKLQEVGSFGLNS
jgi:hypothetical protein